MIKKSAIILILFAVVLLSACSHRNKVTNPLADLGSKQPDKVLFDRAMDALQHHKYDVARLSFQTLINTYPDSEFIARAKLGVADSWYAEGTNTAMAQAEAEYKDFETFFPNMPEAAEAQLKVAGIHFKEMQKPDRDYTHAKRAEDEYRQLIQQYPDSKLVPEAKQRLREVQEVLGEREFRIGRFYFLRESFPAAIARLKTLADQYPLYSNSEEALFLLGQSYEGQVRLLRESPRVDSALREKMIGELHKKASEAYARVITRYPVTGRAADARARLKSLSFPVPEPTPEAVAQNKEEEVGRRETGMMGRVMGNFKSRPSVESAAKTGEPSLEDTQPMSATQVVRDLGTAMSETGKSTATIETVKPGEVQPNQATPRSDSTPGAGESSLPETKPTEPNQQGPSPDTAKPAPAPSQMNEAAKPESDKPAAQVQTGISSQGSNGAVKEESTSKKKKKKKLGIF